MLFYLSHLRSFVIEMVLSTIRRESLVMKHIRMARVTHTVYTDCYSIKAVRLALSVKHSITVRTLLTIWITNAIEAWNQIFI